MAQFFTDFDEYPVGDVSTSGQTDWTPRISNGVSDYRIIDGGDADGKFLRISTSGGANGSRVLGFNPLNGVGDNIETLVKFWIFKAGADGSVGRFGASYIRYDGNTEATTKGYAISFVPVSSQKSIVMYEDSTGVVQYAQMAWSMSTDYFIRTRLSGNDRFVKIWPASSAEPAGWTFSSSAAPPAIANPYSGVGTYQGDSFLYVKQYSAGTNGDTAPMSRPQYTVAFNSDGGSSVSSQTVPLDGTATPPANPTKSGFTFVGWMLNGVRYNFSAQVKGNITLTAAWTPDSTPTVGYGGGHGAITGYGVAYGEALRASFPPPANIFHDHTLSHVSLIRNIILAPQSIAQGQSVSSVALQQQHTLAVNSINQGHALDVVALQQQHLLTAADLFHAHVLDAITITQQHILAPESLQHTQTIENVVLQQSHLLAPHNVSQAHYLESPQIYTQFELVVANILHGHTLQATQVLKKTKLKGAIVEMRKTIAAGDVVDSRPRGEYRRTIAPAPKLKGGQKPRIEIDRQKPWQM